MMRVCVWLLLMLYTRAPMGVWELCSKNGHRRSLTLARHALQGLSNSALTWMLYVLPPDPKAFLKRIPPASSRAPDPSRRKWILCRNGPLLVQKSPKDQGTGAGDIILFEEDLNLGRVEKSPGKENVPALRSPAMPIPQLSGPPMITKILRPSERARV